MSTFIIYQQTATENNNKFKINEISLAVDDNQQIKLMLNFIDESQTTELINELNTVFASSFQEVIYDKSKCLMTMSQFKSTSMVYPQDNSLDILMNDFLRYIAGLYIQLEIRRSADTYEQSFQQNLQNGTTLATDIVYLKLVYLLVESSRDENENIETKLLAQECFEAILQVSVKNKLPVEQMKLSIDFLQLKYQQRHGLIKHCRPDIMLPATLVCPHEFAANVTIKTLMLELNIPLQQPPELTILAAPTSKSGIRAVSSPTIFGGRGTLDIATHRSRSSTHLGHQEQRSEKPKRCSSPVSSAWQPANYHSSISTTPILLSPRLKHAEKKAELEEGSANVNKFGKIL